SFQAKGAIRALHVTGVQTYALRIFFSSFFSAISLSCSRDCLMLDLDFSMSWIGRTIGLAIIAPMNLKNPTLGSCIVPDFTLHLEIGRASWRGRTKSGVWRVLCQRKA